MLTTRNAHTVGNLTMSRSWKRRYAAAALAAMVAYHNTRISVVTSPMISLAREAAVPGCVAPVAPVAEGRAHRQRIAAFRAKGDVALVRGGGGVGNSGHGEKADGEKKGRHDAFHCECSPAGRFPAATRVMPEMEILGDYLREKSRERQREITFRGRYYYL